MHDHRTAERLPVTVIGGYLGAGKTTLMNHLLRNADGVRLAILVNEFGALPIDIDLIESVDQRVIGLSGGCVCCSYGNDLIAGMVELAALRPRPEHVLLEASGVALPAAIAATVALLPGWVLDGVIVIADAETVQQRADDPYMGETVLQQLVDADIVVANKTDLVPATARQQVTDWLQGVAPQARVITTCQAAVPASVVFGTVDRSQPNRKTVYQHHAADMFVSVSFEPDTAINVEQFAQALAHPALGLVRAKGHVKSADGQMQTVQVVGRRWAVTSADDTVSGGMVCIGIRAQINHTALDDLLSRYASGGKMEAADEASTGPPELVPFV